MHSNVSQSAQTLILGLLHHSPAYPAALQISHLPERDWDHLIRVARMHRLGPVLHDGITRKGLKQYFPARVLKALHGAHRIHTLRNLNLYQELVAISRLFEAGQIPSIALKGAFLANFAYPEMGLRPMRDLDLLVPREHAVPAFNLLKQHGYRPSYDGLPEAYLEGIKIHLPTLVGPSGISVELHHRLTFPHPENGAGNFEQNVWTRRISKQIGNTLLNFPCAEDMLFHLCYHATFGHQFSIGPLALMDIAVLLRSHRLDWEDTLQTAAGGYQHCLLAPLYLAKRHLGADVPDWVLAELEDGESGRQWQESAEYLLFSELSDHMLLNSNMQKILCSKNPLERASALARAIFPARSAIASHFPVHANSPKVLLYYPKNWQRLLKKKLPSLMSSLASRPREVEKLAAHKQAFSEWLETRPQGKAAQ